MQLQQKGKNEVIFNEEVKKKFEMYARFVVANAPTFRVIAEDHPNHDALMRRKDYILAFSKKLRQLDLSQCFDHETGEPVRFDLTPNGPIQLPDELNPNVPCSEQEFLQLMSLLEKEN